MSLFEHEPIISKRPISMTAESIVKIERDLKSQTRRVIYPQPASESVPLPRCPYGKPGDKLWVREVWARVEPYPGIFETYTMPHPWRPRKDTELRAYWLKRVIYLRDFPDREPEQCGRGSSDNLWRSPVTMPQWASRLWLEVLHVRPERLHQISTDDIEREGIELTGNYRQRWRELWDSINGRNRKAGLHPAKENSWDSNPWVWVIGFRRAED